MSVQSAQLARDLEQAFKSIGSSMMSDDFAAKLLAYVYVMGGGNEAVTLHEGLNAGINIAQEKANIKGGEIPDRNMMLLIQQRIRELEKDMNDTEWLPEIFTRYNLDPKKGPKGPVGYSSANK